MVMNEPETGACQMTDDERHIALLHYLALEASQRQATQPSGGTRRVSRPRKPHAPPGRTGPSVQGWGLHLAPTPPTKGPLNKRTRPRPHAKNNNPDGNDNPTNT